MSMKAGFMASQGQQASVHFGGNTLGSVTATLLGPGGLALASLQSASDSFDLQPVELAATGAYTVEVVPSGSTMGGINVSLQLTGGSNVLRPYGVSVDPSNPLASNLAGLFLMNDGRGATTSNIVDGSPAKFSGGFTPMWNPLDPFVEFWAGGSLNSYLDAGADQVFDQLTPGKMTIVAKIWVDRYTAGGIAEKNDGGVDSGFAFGMDGNGSLRLAVETYNSRYCSCYTTYAGTVGAVIPTGKWVQVAMTWDGGGGPDATAAHFFVAGVEQSRAWTNNGNGSVDYANATSQPFRIGNANIDATGSFNGKMQYVAVYKGRVLTPVELQQLDVQLPIK